MKVSEEERRLLKVSEEERRLLKVSEEERHFEKLCNNVENLSFRLSVLFFTCIIGLSKIVIIFNHQNPGREFYKISGSLNDSSPR